MKIKYLILTLFFSNCQSNMKKATEAPICKTENKVLTAHNDERIDQYYWLNNRENPDVIE